MTIQKRTATVKQLPQILSDQQGQTLLREILAAMDRDRPCVVLDCCNMQPLNKAGISLMLGCLEEARKRNGDVKLAVLPVQAAAELQRNGARRLFDVFETTEDAVNSFHAFPATSIATSAMSVRSQDQA